MPQKEEDTGIEEEAKHNFFFGKKEQCIIASYTIVHLYRTEKRKLPCMHSDSEFRTHIFSRKDSKFFGALLFGVSVESYNY